MLTDTDCTELDQERHADHVAEAVKNRATALESARLLTLSKYTQQQQAAALHLYQTVKRHVGTSGGNTLAKVLLGLYNGPRFPFDLTDLRLLDADNFIAAMTVIHMDSRHTWCEIHVLLDAILGSNANTGAEFEHWAYNLKLKGRCKADQLPTLNRVVCQECHGKGTTRIPYSSEFEPCSACTSRPIAATSKATASADASGSNA